MRNSASTKNKKVSRKKISEWIQVKGAKENNLKNFDLDLPKQKLIVLTGPSGSGKSSLAFDTIYSEGQRRYIESLSAYAKQFVEQLKKPDVESITGLCPSLAIQQKRISQNPRSTVATISEIYDYLRLLYSRVGKLVHPETGEEIAAQSISQIAENIFKMGDGAKLSVLAIVAEQKKGAFSKEIDRFVRMGFVHARIDGNNYELQLGQKLDKNKRHDFELYIDRLILKPGARMRLEEAIEKATELGQGRFKIVDAKTKKEQSFSRSLSSSDGSFSVSELTPRLFSFNSPVGACPSCRGIGLVLAEEVDFGEEIDFIEEEWVDTEKVVCPSCLGSRLKEESRCVFVGDKSIDEVHAMSIREAKKHIESLKFTGNQALVSEKILQELKSHLGFLDQVGLDYLNLNRRTSTLSGGEEQRVRLATQMGVHLRGVLYVLDEPSIGLHQYDNDRLIEAMKSLRDMGNTVLVVEHDIDTMKAADELIDLGPEAGLHGGYLVAQAAPGKLKKGITAEYLSGKRRIELPESRRRASDKVVKIHAASHHNLKSVDVEFPIGRFVVVTGVSGSGKSSLVLDVLAQSLSESKPRNCKKLEGAEHVDKVIQVSQSPIGRSPRSNPATYIGMFGPVRELFAQAPLARQRGYSASRFSFNVSGGRCDACQGAGQIKIQMHFLPNVYVKCDNCYGRRYNRATLEVLFKGKNIHEILEMTFSEAAEFFSVVPQIQRRAQTMCEVGLGYIKLGQSALSLSGGEAQRVKLARELSKKTKGSTLYILDEPTTGLHLVDVEQLIRVCQRLVDEGATVVVIEHHLDVVKSADEVIDLGPLGGERGGELVAQGSPESLAENKDSLTGRYLKLFLEDSKEVSNG